MHIKPAPGLTLIDPDMLGTPDAVLPPEGRDVGELSPYWVRRLRDGDVQLASMPPAPAPDTPAP